ncbi:MAG: hypothetical protein ACTHU0_19290 [Kofleriaceae bacterium]
MRTAWCIACDGPQQVDAKGCVGCRAKPSERCIDCGKESTVMLTMTSKSIGEHRVCRACWRAE